MDAKKVAVALFFAILMIGICAPKIAHADTLNYPNVFLTSNGTTDSGHFNDEWDLTAGDMVISFTYNATGLADSESVNWGDHAWAAFGVRAVGYADFNPPSGTGVWLATDYDEWQSGVMWSNKNTFASDAASGAPYFPILDMDDKLILQRTPGHGEGDYNLPSAPPAPGNNHRVWWDRDGVDPYQNNATANTGGIYQIVMTLHATSATTGTAYMTIRGLAQGFEVDGNWNTIELTPAGMTFTFPADTCLQVYYGLYGYGATNSVAFTDISVTGQLCPYLTVNVDPLGLVTIPGEGYYCTDATLTAPSGTMTNPFLYWDVDGVSQGSLVNPITVTMDADHTATAHYYVQGVGGEWAPIQTVQTIVPYVLLGLALAGALTAGSWSRLKKH